MQKRKQSEKEEHGTEIFSSSEFIQQNLSYNIIKYTHKKRRTKVYKTPRNLCTTITGLGLRPGNNLVMKGRQVRFHQRLQHKGHRRVKFVVELFMEIVNSFHTIVNYGVSDAARGRSYISK